MASDQVMEVVQVFRLSAYAVSHNKDYSFQKFTCQTFLGGKGGKKTDKRMLPISTETHDRGKLDSAQTKNQNFVAYSIKCSFLFLLRFSYTNLLSPKKQNKNGM